MSRPARVTSVEHLGGRVLKLVFTDGLVRELDFEGALQGILATGADFDPDVLHGDQAAVAAHQPRLLSEYRLQETS